MVLIVGDEAIYSELSTLECEIFMQILPQGTLLQEKKGQFCLALKRKKDNSALLSGGKRKSNCLALRRTEFA